MNKTWGQSPSGLLSLTLGAVERDSSKMGSKSLRISQPSGGEDFINKSLSFTSYGGAKDQSPVSVSEALSQ